MANRITKAFEKIKVKDLFSPFVFLVLLIPSILFRLTNKIKKRDLWLISEEGEARDNGYHFYKYVRINHPLDYCFYAIKKESASYEKVSELGNVIKWGSLRHWLYYMSANLNISSQKSGNPCPIFWYVMHVTFGLYKNRVFLQHGITKDDSKWIYQNKTKFKYFVCGAKREYDYILKKFGYKKENLLLTGFPRWDNLKDTSKNQKNKSILIMPTWRNWLGGDRNSMFKVKDFEQTNFYRRWNSLLSSKDFINFIEKNNIVVYFYPHINMMGFIDLFKSKSKNINIVQPDNNIQNYFNKCNIMITDYSSVAFDFAYLDKPVLYYQFDKEEYRRRQYQEGYFRYERDGFGPVVENAKDVVDELDRIILNKVKYQNNIEKFFGNKTLNNSRKLYYSLSSKSDTNTRYSDKKISIIIPVYNGEKYIGKCLNQILTQNYKNLEILVIDDGSNDNTVSIVTEYSKNNQAVKLLKQNHAGPNAARKNGVRKASGDIIMFVDSDDYIADGALLKLAKLFVDNNVDVIRFGAKYLPSGKDFNKLSVNGVIDHDKIIKLLLTTYKLNSLCVQAYKSEVIKKCKGTDYGISLGEDLLFNLEIHENTKNMLVIDDILYYYCDNNNSTTRKKSIEQILKNLQDRVFASNKVIEYAKDEKVSYLGDVMYKQMKMIRDYAIKLPSTRADKKNSLDSMKQILSNIVLEENDIELLKEYLSKLGFVSKARDRSIVTAIANQEPIYIWKYIRMYDKLIRRKR